MGLMDKMREQGSNLMSEAASSMNAAIGGGVSQTEVRGATYQSGERPMQQQTQSYSPAVRVPQYVVLQVVLKEKMIGTGSGNLTELERAINQQAARGYRLHTITTASGASGGLMGGDRIQATMVFEKL